MNPKISVVTVVYNAVETLEQTMLSVLNQTYDNIEYIIIDGGSTDGSVDIIKKYADRLAYWVSEPDKGIYDAMNKGIRKATGDWINFMNAGDTFFEKDTVRSVFAEKIDVSVGVIYGDCCVKTSDFYFHAPTLQLGELQKSMVFCHQASFINMSIMKKNLYNTKYKICADYDFFYKLYRQRGIFYYIKKIICIYDNAGVSSQKYVVSLSEKNDINGGKIIFSRMDYFAFHVRAFIVTHFPLVYDKIKQLQFTLFPKSYKKLGWEKISIRGVK